MIDFKPKAVPQMPVVTTVPYQTPDADMFRELNTFAYPFILESSLQDTQYGRYTFTGHSPFMIIRCFGETLTVTTATGSTQIKSDPFDFLEELIPSYRLPHAPADIPLPGGCVGFFGYDLCHFIEKLPRTTRDDIGFPDMHLAMYDTITVFDHHEQKAYTVHVDFGHAPITQMPQSPMENVSAEESILESDFTKPDYLDAVRRAKEYIGAGDIYQVNLSQQFHIRTQQDPLELYIKLRETSPATYGAYIKFENNTFISSSPEQFLLHDQGRVVTRPIKGTIGRGNTEDEDAQQRERLVNSPKDDAELSMIVDLCRNDIGKVCAFGSVQVTTAKQLESYATLHHLSATVEGTLQPERTLVDLIRAAFPGGSITGTPKIRAMEIIDELEPTKRNAYTGAYGYIGFNERMDLAMSIRILSQRHNDLYFQFGGGLVADSDPELEYEETLVKAQGILKALNLTWTPTSV